MQRAVEQRCRMGTVNRDDSDATVEDGIDDDLAGGDVHPPMGK